MNDRPEQYKDPFAHQPPPSIDIIPAYKIHCTQKTTPSGSGLPQYVVAW